MSDVRILLFAAGANKTAVFGSLLVGILLAAVVNFAQPIMYSTSATVFVATPEWNDMTAIDDPSGHGQAVVTYGDQFTQQRMVSYGKLGSSDLTLNAAADKLGGTTTAAQLRDETTVQPVPETVMLEVRSTNASATGAVNAANAVAEALVDTIQGLESPEPEAISPVQPLIIRPAALPRSPASPQLVLNLVAGAVIGLLAGVTFAAWRTGAQLRSAAAITEMLRSGAALGVLPLGPEDVDGTSSDQSAQLFAIRLRNNLRHNSDSATLVSISAPRGDATAGELSELLARVIRESGSTATAVRIPLTDAESPTDAVDTEMPQSLRDSNDYVFVATGGVLESTCAMDVGQECNAIILVCPVPETTLNECVEAEKLLYLSDTPYLGRVITTTTSATASRTLDRAITTDHHSRT